MLDKINPPGAYVQKIGRRRPECRHISQMNTKQQRIWFGHCFWQCLQFAVVTH